MACEWWRRSKEEEEETLPPLSSRLSPSRLFVGAHVTPPPASVTAARQPRQHPPGPGTSGETLRTHLDSSLPLCGQVTGWLAAG